MKHRPRIYNTETDKALMWDRWQKGESLHSIARLFARHHGSIRGVLARTGGIRPAERKRSKLALTLAEREEISRGIIAGQPIRCIAISLGRAPSTVSREINRNGDRQKYRASTADQAARSSHSKRPFLHFVRGRKVPIAEIHLVVFVPSINSLTISAAGLISLMSETDCPASKLLSSISPVESAFGGIPIKRKTGISTPPKTVVPITGSSGLDS